MAITVSQAMPLRGSLFDQGFPVEWVSTLTAILAVTVWLDLFSYKHFDYANELWWQFAYDADFSRFLRTTLLVFTLVGLSVRAPEGYPTNAALHRARCAAPILPEHRSNLPKFMQDPWASTG